jgi:Ca2+-binding RTX toxin-like protein
MMNQPVTGAAAMQGIQTTASGHDPLAAGAVPSSQAAFTVAASPGSDSVEIPDNHLLQYGTYNKVGSDLVIQGADGGEAVVRGYFALTPPPALQGTNGFELGGSVVQSLAHVHPLVQVADAGDGNEQLAQAATPIGNVGKITGTVTVTRADGTEVTLNAGDPVYQGDVVQTDSGASVGVVFLDGTEMSLGSKGRLVLDEMIYDPTNGEGSSSFSLVSGAFSFVSGQIAKSDPDGMQIKTPVATIGIRGTSGTVKIGDLSVDADSQLQVVLIPDPSGSVGEIIVTSSSGQTSTINVPFGGLNLSSSGGSFQSFTMSANDFVREYGSVIQSLNSNFSNSLPTINDGNTPNGTTPNPQNAPGNGEGGATNPDGEGETGGNGEQKGDAGGQGDAEAPQGGAEETAKTAEPQTTQQSGTVGQNNILGSNAIKVTNIPGPGANTGTGTGSGAGTNGSTAINGTGSTTHGANTNTNTHTGTTTTGTSANTTSNTNTDTDNSHTGSTNTGTTTPTTTVSSSGTVVDPYVSGATVFRDTNNNRILDAGEQSTTTDANGKYTFTGSSTATVVSIGGVDTTTGVAQGMLVAPEGATVVSPLTTLLSAMVASGAAASIAEAATSLKTSLGLNSALDLTTYDPVAGLEGTGAAAETAALVLSVSVMIQNVLSMVSATLQGAGASASAATSAAAAALSAALSSGSRSILTNPTSVASIINTAATDSAVSSSVDSGKIANAVSGVSTAIVSVSTKMESVISQGNPSDLKTQLKGVALVAQRDAANDIQSATSDGTADSLSNSYSESSVSSKSTTAQSESASSSIINGTVGNDTLTGTAAADQIYGGDGNDVITAGAGNDRVYGQGGNDTFVGGAGNDTFFGGSGTDTVTYATTSAALVINLANGAAISNEIGSDTFSSIERVVGGSGNDQITGSAAADIIDGGAGNDTIIGGGGADALSGGAGTDTLDLSADAEGVSINLATGSGTIGDASVTLSSFEVIKGGSGDDTLQGSAAAETLIGGAGNDTLSSGGGADSLDGGTGTDTLSLAAQSKGATVNMATGTATIDGSAVTFSSIEVVLGGSGSDLITGSAAADTIGGGAGNDTLNGAAGDDLYLYTSGNDVITDSAGNDALDLGSASLQTVTVSGSDVILTTNLGTITLSGQAEAVVIETLYIGEVSYKLGQGTSGKDILYANTPGVTLSGGDGGDILYGGSNHTVLDGGTGDDRMILNQGSAGTRVETEIRAGDGLDTLVCATGTGYSFETVVFLDNGLVGIELSNGNQVFIANSGADLEKVELSGVTYDVVAGTTGGDSAELMVVELSDTQFPSQTPVTVDAGGGNDVVLMGYTGAITDLQWSPTSWTPADGTDGYGFYATSVNLNSVTVSLGDGDDQLVLGGVLSGLELSSAGTVFLAPTEIDGGAGTDTVRLASSMDFSHTTFTGVETLEIVNGASAEFFDGLPDGVEITGDGTGTLKVHLQSMASVDLSSVSVSGVAGVVIGVAENPVFEAATATMIGTSGDDTLIGWDGNNSLDGGAGSDTLLGGSSADTLVYDAADSTIDGGSGIDTLVVKGSFDMTSVSNVSAIDAIHLEVTDSANLVISSSWIINNTDDGVLYLSGATAGNITGAALWEYSNSTSSGSVSYDVYTSGGAELWVDTGSGLDISAILGTDPGLGAAPTLQYNVEDINHYFSGGMVVLNDVGVLDDAGDTLTLVLTASAGALQVYDLPETITATGAGTTTLTLVGSQAAISTLLSNDSVLVDTSGVTEALQVTYAVTDSTSQTASHTISYSQTTDATTIADIDYNGKIAAYEQGAVNALHSGDVNGDGFDDLIIQHTVVAGESGQTGYQTEIVFGSAGGAADYLSLETAVTDKVGLITDMPFATESTYTSVIGVADVNGDGYADLLVLNQYDQTQTLSVLFGGDSAFSGSKTLDSVAKATIALDSAFLSPYQTLKTAATGDINGDGVADVVVIDRSSALVIFGSETLHAGSNVGVSDTFSGAEGNPNLLGTTLDMGSSVIQSVMMADVTGDGLDDLVITASYMSEAIETVVFDGNTLTQGGTLDRSDAAWILNHNDGLSGFATNQSYAGDFNGDGIDDLVFTASQGGERVTRVVFGGSGQDGKTYASDQNIQYLTINSTISEYQSDTGNALAVGDINGDGIDDLALLVEYYTSQEGYASSRVYVMMGGASSWTASSTADLQALEVAGNALSFSVSAYSYNSSLKLAMVDLDGDGFDELVVTVGGANGEDMVVLDRDSLINRDSALIVATAENDASISDTASNDIIVAGAGDDTIVSASGNDTISGGNGQDTLSFAGRTEGVTVQMATGSYMIGEAAQGSFNGIEAVSGSAFDDTLYGSAMGETLIGAGGDDTIVGGGGADVLSGGAGDDIIMWSSDALSIHGDAGTADTLVVNENGVQVTLENGSVDISGFEFVTLSGAADTLFASADLGQSSDINAVYVTGDSNDLVTGEATWIRGDTSVVGSETYQAFTNSVTGVVLHVDQDLRVEGLLDTGTSDVYAQQAVVAAGVTSSLTGIELGDVGGLSGTSDVVLTLSVSTGTLSLRQSAASLQTDGSAGTLTVTGTLSELRELIDNGSILITTDGTETVGTLDLSLTDTNDDTFTDSVTLTITPSAEALASGSGSGGMLLSGSSAAFTQIVSGDFDGDGIDDTVIFGADSEGNARTYLMLGDKMAGDGYGHIDQAITLTNMNLMAGSMGPYDFTKVSVGDINGDGIDDLVLGTSNSGMIVAAGSEKLSDMGGASTNVWTMEAITADTIDATYTSIQNILTGDFNGDGIDDVVLNFGGSTGSGGIFYGSNSDDTWSLASPDVTLSDFTNGLGQSQSMGDFNKDGYDDLVWSSSAGTVTAIEGNGYGYSSTVAMSWGGVASALAVNLSGDFNGDGYNDLVVLDAVGKQASVVLGTASGFGTISDLGSDGTVISATASLGALGAAMTTGDINGDGLDDLIFYSVASDQNSGFIDVLFGQSTLSWSDVSTDSNGLHLTTTLTSGSADTFTVSDLNGDGFDDISFTTMSSGGSLAVVEAISGGDFTNQAAYVASSAGGSYAGTSAAELIIGGSGDDTLTGNGADTLRGAAGDDTFTIVDSSAMTIDGGGGLDVVRADAGLSLDLQSWQDLDSLTLGGNSSLTITAEILNQLVGGSNEAAVLLGASASEANNIFIISGDSTDTVTTDNLTFIDAAGDLGSNVDSYTVYQDPNTSAMLYVENTITTLETVS